MPRSENTLPERPKQKQGPRLASPPRFIFEFPGCLESLIDVQAIRRERQEQQRERERAKVIFVQRHCLAESIHFHLLGAIQPMPKKIIWRSCALCRPSLGEWEVVFQHPHEHSTT